MTSGFDGPGESGFGSDTERGMPLVRIAFRAGRRATCRMAVSEGVHQAVVQALGIPHADRFHIVSEHAAADLVYVAGYLGVARSDDIVIIQIALSAGRASTESKLALYRALVERLGKAAGFRPADIFVDFVEVAPESWSFGNGEAQYVRN